MTVGRLTALPAALLLTALAAVPASAVAATTTGAAVSISPAAAGEILVSSPDVYHREQPASWRVMGFPDGGYFGELHVFDKQGDRVATERIRDCRYYCADGNVFEITWTGYTSEPDGSGMVVEPGSYTATAVLLDSHGREQPVELGTVRVWHRRSVVRRVTLRGSSKKWVTRAGACTSAVRTGPRRKALRLTSAKRCASRKPRSNVVRIATRIPLPTPPKRTVGIADVSVYTDVAPVNSSFNAGRHSVHTLRSRLGRKWPVDLGSRETSGPGLHGAAQWTEKADKEGRPLGWLNGARKLGFRLTVKGGNRVIFRRMRVEVRYSHWSMKP